MISFCFSPWHVCCLQGHIKASLGTHGLMKCVFNDFLKQNDVVCMPLYRRVFPVWHERAWNPHAVDKVKPKHATFDREMLPCRAECSRWPTAQLGK